VLADKHPQRRDSARRAALVEHTFDDAIAALEGSRALLRSGLVAAADALGACFRAGGKVLICGNGGSAADAQHLAAELVGRFRRSGRAALPAVALGADSAVVTAWSNDCSFERVFERQVEALGRPGDVLVGISTSGRSANVARAFEAARRAGMVGVALLGSDGGEVRPLADVAVVAPTADTQRVQEVHAVLLHALCELVEDALSETPAAHPVVTRLSVSDRRRDVIDLAGSDRPEAGRSHG
jgi:phosphoheptose isomerase